MPFRKDLVLIKNFNCSLTQARAVLRVSKLANPFTRKKFRKKSATVIQAAFRGMLGRRVARLRREAKQRKADERAAKKLDGMARRIQRVWGGYRVRKWLFQIKSRKYVWKIEAAWIAYKNRSIMRALRRHR